MEHTPFPRGLWKEAKGMVHEIEKQSRRDYLDLLIEDFEREQTIQDVGAWLIENPLDPLPPKHVQVLMEWLQTHNHMAIKHDGPGTWPSTTRNNFYYITRLHRDTGMSVEAASELVVERLGLNKDPANLMREYDRARTPETRLLNATVKATGAFSTGSPAIPKVKKALNRFKTAKAAQKEAKAGRNRTQKP